MDRSVWTQLTLLSVGASCWFYPVDGMALELLLSPFCGACWQTRSGEVCQPRMTSSPPGVRPSGSPSKPCRCDVCGVRLPPVGESVVSARCAGCVSAAKQTYPV